MLTLVSKIKKELKKGGMPKLVKTIRGRMFETNSAWWLFRDLSKPITDFPMPIPLSLTVERNNDVIQYMQSKGYISKPEIEIASRMGHWFIGLVVNDEIKGFCKCGFQEVYVNDFQKTIRIPQNFAFPYEMEIDETVRGKGVGHFFLSAVLRRFAYVGYDFAVCHIPPWNKASFAMAESAGFVRHSFVRFVKVTGLKFTTRDVCKLLRSKCISHP